MTHGLRELQLIAVAVMVLFSVQSSRLWSAGVIEGPEQAAATSRVFSTSPEQLVALDLVGALMQLESLHPDRATLFMQPETDAFGANLRQILEMVEYTMASANDVDGAIGIDYTTFDKYTERGVVRTYQVNAGQVKVRRDYLVIEDNVQPVSTIYVRGTDAQGITLNDEIFLASMEPPMQSQHTVSATPESAGAIPVILMGTIDQATFYRMGAPIVVSVSSDRPARLYCYYRDGHGQITKVFPNRFNTDNLVQAGYRVMIPATDAWAISATRVGTSDDFLCVATDPLNKEVIEALDEDPDLEPLAARSLDQIQQGLTASTDRPIAFQKLFLAVE